VDSSLEGEILERQRGAVVSFSSESLQLLVVTPTLGQSPWLDETVASVAGQSFPCAHVLVAPLAAVPDLARRYPHVRVVTEPGGGMYAAINAGLAAVENWRAFTYINDDDLLLPRLARVMARARTAEARIVYGGVRLINTQGRRIGAIPISPVPSLNRLLYAQRTEPVFQHGTIVTRAVVERLGPFDTTLRFCGDSEFLARACVAGIPFVCATKQVVAAFRLRAGQLTKDLPAMLAEHHVVYNKHRLPAERITLKHRWARFVFRMANLPVYAERVARHGFITFGEQLAQGK
jgi:glycosyltransferase involved in cell wall biosynthesis